MWEKFQKRQRQTTQTCDITATNQGIGSRNAEIEKHQEKNIQKGKKRHLSEPCLQEYNLEVSSDAWHMWNRREFDTVENIKIGDGKYIQAIESRDIDILAFSRKGWVRKHARTELQSFLGGCSSFDKGLW